jgi:hypothetical protein
MADDKKTKGEDLTAAGAAQTVQDAQQPQDSRSATATAPKGGGRKLLPASESGSADVHQLLAILETAKANGDTDAQDQVHKDLAKLGYQAG